MSLKRTPKKQPQGDWINADIVAALHKKGWSFRRLSLHHGYAPGTLKLVLHRHWPKAERLVADAIGETVETIWPSRYPKHTSGAIGDNVKRGAAA